MKDAMENERQALQSRILRRRQRETWTTAAVFFWMFAIAVGIAIFALLWNR